MLKAIPIKIRTVLLDMDGVLWQGSQPLLDIKKLLAGFQKLGCQVYCVTNNSTKTVSAYLTRLQSFGLELDESQVITSSEATAAYLTNRFPAASKIFVVGEKGLRQTISDYGFTPTNKGNAEKAVAVVVGLDRDFRYADLNRAVQHIRQGAEFIGTNPDRTIPTPEGPAPGAGAIIELIETSCGKKATLIGKPAAGLYQLALSRSGSSPQETLMIGDRLETDILGAQRLAIRTGLVLSGISSREDGEKWDPAPDLVAADALGILEMLEESDGKLV